MDDDFPNPEASFPLHVIATPSPACPRLSREICRLFASANLQVG